jgi:hypothetical protein
MSYFTNQWSYLEFDISRANIETKGDGHKLVRSDVYKWFADRKSNTAYDYPEYYLVFSGHSLGDLIYALKTESKGQTPVRASGYPLVQDTRNGKLGTYGIEEVARDESGFDRWSVIKLDWSKLD